LITLLQETISTIQAIQSEVRRIAQGSKGPAKTVQKLASVSDEGEAPLQSIPSLEPLMWADDEQALWRDPAEIEEVMRPRNLRLEPNVRPSEIPVLGGLLRQLRIALHNLVLFYANQLASKQGEVNRVYGEWFLYLNEQLQFQREQIEFLREQMAELQAHLRQTEQS